MSLEILPHWQEQSYDTKYGILSSRSSNLVDNTLTTNEIQFTIAFYLNPSVNDNKRALFHLYKRMNADNKWTNELVELRNNWLKFIKSSGELPIIFEESLEYALNEWKRNRNMSTCNRLDLESLGSWPTLYAQKLPGHCLALLRY